jgi:hypothetical protein
MAMHFIYLLSINDSVKAVIDSSPSEKYTRDAVWKMVVRAKNDIEARTLASVRESVRSNISTLEYWNQAPDQQLWSIDCSLMGVAVETDSKVICTHETHF